MALSSDPEKREKQLANLHPFGKGENGQTRKPKGTIDLKRRLECILLEPCQGDKEKRTNVEIFIRAELLRAQKGDKEARAMIWAQFGEAYGEDKGFPRIMRVYFGDRELEPTTELGESNGA